MPITLRSTIYDAESRPEFERIAFFPSLCLLRDGTILAGMQVGSKKHAPNSTARLARSHDQGATWEEIAWKFETNLDGIPGSLGAPELVEAEPGRLLLFATWFDRSEPERPLFDPVTQGILHSRLLVAVSSDGGTTWGPWQRIPTPGLAGCASTGPVLRWPNGSIAYAFESFKEFDDPQPGHHAAWLAVSHDGGRSFGPPLRVAQHPAHELYYWDQRLCVAGENGEFLALFWTHDLVSQRDRTVHLTRGRIADGWMEVQAPSPTSLPGQIAAPLLLQDGRLLAFVVDRDRPGTLKLWTSRDGGSTWPEAEAGVVHAHEERAQLSQGREQIDFRQYWEDMGKWSFGHPVVRQVGPHRVLLVWYAGTPQAMSIHCARLDLT
ncbi:MAG: sialidase family protein [Gemmataceae bacterium]